jgi:hypothetical protein
VLDHGVDEQAADSQIAIVGFPGLPQEAGGLVKLSLGIESARLLGEELRNDVVLFGLANQFGAFLQLGITGELDLGFAQQRGCLFILPPFDLAIDLTGRPKSTKCGEPIFTAWPSNPFSPKIGFAGVWGVSVHVLAKSVEVRNPTNGPSHGQLNTRSSCFTLPAGPSV